MDSRVSAKLKRAQKSLRIRFQERMKSHCDVVYKECLKQYGVVEMGVRTERVNKTADRRSIRIAALVRQRRELRKSLRRTQPELERGSKPLLK